MSVRKVSYFGVFFGLANLLTKQKTAADKRPAFSASRFTAVAMLMFGLLANTIYAQTITTVAGPGSYDEFGKPIVGDGGSAQLAYIDSPRRIAVAPDGSIYIADLLNNVVRKILPNGIITTYAGTYSPYGGYGGDGGPATGATLNSPNGVALDAAGNLYIADYNNFLIRKVAPDGIITTFIGDRNFGNSPDGSNGTSASIGLISGMAVDSAGNLYISTVHHNQIRKVTPDGYIYTVAGNGSSGFSGDGGLAINARLSAPIAVAVDGAGNIFIADIGNNRIRKVNTSGVISTVAGSHSIYGSFGGDGGPATSAFLNSPYGIDVDANGSFYIADSLNNRIRKVGADGIISTIAGTGDGLYNGDDINSVTASLNNPLDVVVMPGGIVFIADTYHGRVRKLTPASPGAPVIGVAYTGHARARVEFTPPTRDGGASITGYTVTSLPAGGIDNQAGSIALSHEITGLNNGTAYTFTVTATNVVGAGPASATSNSVTPHPYPGAPFIGVATGGNAQATVNFTAPNDSGSGPITGYTVMSFPSGGVDSHAGSTSFSHIVTGLTNGVAYTFTVKARNADGFGPESASSNSVTPLAPLTVPNAPSISSAVAGNMQATVGLNAPANNGGTAITGYTVVSSPAGGVDNNADTTGLSHVISGLSNGTSYTFTAVAKNAVGTSSASAPSNAVTPATFPDAPAITNVVAGNAQATLSLTAPANNGGNAITGYTVTSSPAGGIDANAGTTNLNRTITGLVNGTSYTFTATATNSFGISNPSPASASVNPATVPGAPIMGAASGGNAKATVNFMPPSNDGGRTITGYTVTSFPSGGVDTNAGTTNLNHLMTGLANGTPYTFSVKATNAIGTSAASATSNTITPAYTPPTLSISDAAAIEGDSGTRTLTFTISLSEPSTSSVNFNIATSNGTATAGSDYAANSVNNQQIATGAISTTFAVTINGDAVIEANESFNVTVSNVAGAAAGDLTAVGTILNDDFSGGTITSIAGGSNGDGGLAVNAYLRNSSEGIAFDSNGNLYIAETYKHRIRKVTPAGIITTVAGMGESGFSGDGGAATSAMLYRPHAVAVDASGNLYIGDSSNNRIRKVTPGGVISTIAGNGSYATTGDGGSAINASVASPSSMAIGPGNSLYFVDGNTRIRKITSGGVISTIVGNGSYTYGGDGGSAINAGVNPYNIAVDTSGNIYITDHTNYRIRKVTAADNIIRTIAGNGTWGHSGDGGPATSAGLDPPYAIGVDSLGNVSFSEYNSDRVRKIDTTGKITTIGGNGGTTCPTPGNLAICAHFFDAYGLAVASDRSTYVLSGSVVNKIDLNGVVSKVAGGGGGESSGGYSGDGGQAINAILNENQSVATDNNGNIFIADTRNHRIRKIAADGMMSTYAGTGVAGFSGDGLDASQALFNEPTMISTDTSGNLYVLDSGNNRIRKIATNKIITTIAGNGQFNSNGDTTSATSSAIAPVDIAADSSGNLYIAEAGYGRVRKVSPDGMIMTVAGNGQYGFSGDGGLATNASFRGVMGVDVDASGNLFIVDRNNYRIRRVSRTGIVETIAGTGVSGVTGDNGDALLARIQDTYFIKVDQSGNVFIDDYPRIRKISTSGIMSTVAGNGVAGFSGDGGLATDAKTSPSDITTDSAGNLYFADSTNNRIRKVTPLVGGETAPSAPTIMLATAGDRSASVEILPPASNGGSAVSGYTVTSFPAGGVDSNAGSLLTNHVMTGLTNGVEYKFKVIASNAIGTSQTSGFSNAVIPLPLLSVSNVSLLEGNSGVRSASFVISLSTPAVNSGASFDIVTSDVRSIGNAAQAKSDYVANASTRLLIPNGQSSINYTVKIIGDKLIERDEKFVVNASNPGGAIISVGTGVGIILNDDNGSLTVMPDNSNPAAPVIVGQPDSNDADGFISISAIQGRELISPYIGRQVRTRGIVTALTGNGFFMQSSDLLKDANPESSEGIFVFTRNKPGIAKGSLVSVEGKVEEARQGVVVNQLSFTQIVATHYTTISGNHALPAAVKLGLQDMSPSQSQYWLERFEGMLVSMPRMKVVGPVGALVKAESAKTVSDGIFYVTAAMVAKPFREPGINRLDNAPIQKGINPVVFDGNPEIIRVDSIGLQGAAKISVDSGDYVANLRGILNYADGAYTLMPEANAKPLIQSGATPRAATRPGKSELTIANFNLGRLFDDQDNSAIKEPVLGGNRYIARLAKTANAICSYANNPDILAVSEVENFAALSDLASAINSNAGNILSPNQCRSDPKYLPYMATGKAGNASIGFLISNVQAWRGVPRIQVLSVERLGASARFTHPDGSSEPLNEQPTLLAKIRVNLRDGRTRSFSVLATDLDNQVQTNNVESGRGGWEDAESYSHAKHRAQAVHLAALLQARQTASTAENIIVLGGFNATEFSDGYDDALGIITGRQASREKVLNYAKSPITRPLINLTTLMPKNERYSAIWQGNAMALDHVLVNQAVIDSGVTLKTEFVRINADFGADNSDDFTLPIRNSSNDPVVLYLGVENK